MGATESWRVADMHVQPMLPYYVGVARIFRGFIKGQVSAQRAALYVKKHGKSHSKGVANFIEESIVRRELSDNFCFYNENYDNLDGASTVDSWHHVLPTLYICRVQSAIR